MACYVIGDIHGCCKELACLIEKLPLKSNDSLIFLGDYIDRGPDSKAVVSYLLDLQQDGCCDVSFLKGNHEAMLLSFLGLGGEYGEMFFYNGGVATLASYGLSTQTLANEYALSAIPPDHIEFYKNLENSHIVTPYLCVHAGIDPMKPLEQQSETELLWIRNKFIYSSHALPYTVLFGHTPQSDVFFDLPYKIGLDTGLVYGNKLTCLETEERLLFQVTRGKNSVKRTAIPEKWESSRRLMTP